MKTVNKSIKKLDSMNLVTGKPVYVEDMIEQSALVVQVLRSPHAYARIIDIDKEKAEKLTGIEGIYTYQDVPRIRFTMAGQSYPEPSPYDRLILDQYVRYVGDPVAIVAGRDKEVVAKALKLIKVTYDILTPVLNFEEALDHPSIIHQEEDYFVHYAMGNDPKRNLCCSGTYENGDIESELSNADILIDEVYHTKANNQAMMEPFKTYTKLDVYGRLTVISSTQVPFHVRRIVARALDIPKSQVKVIKPRIGGGFGAKQTIVSEVFPAFVTIKTGKPAAMIFTREECFMGATSRHEMKIRIRLGADKEGNIKGIHLHTLSNTGAYGEHGPTTVGLSGTKSIPLYNKAKAYKFDYEVVYTNTMSAGAFRGYGATQGTFALESAINQLADELKMDPVELRLKNLLETGEVLPAYYHETLGSCGLKECIHRGKELIGWNQKYPKKMTEEGKIRSLGMAITMQGSGISGLDIASAEIMLQEDGYYTLMIGATDMGTGCDTILAQIAAESLQCDIDKIVVHGVDTDVSPYDTGSYASSTTYVTGNAVIKACDDIKSKIIEKAGAFLGIKAEEVEFDGKKILGGSREIMLREFAEKMVVGNGARLAGVGTHSSPVSPPPFMAGFVELETDLETGKIAVVQYVGVVDCGTPINPNLARIQTEGGIVQGIGMALFEEITYNGRGKMMNNSFMQYKIPSRVDVGNIRVEFESSYEHTGPFGAKSIGEVVINTPSPAIAHAVHNATGSYFRTLPIRAEDIIFNKHES